MCVDCLRWHDVPGIVCDENLELPLSWAITLSISTNPATRFRHLHLPEGSQIISPCLDLSRLLWTRPTFAATTIRNVKSVF